jgi:5-methylcytosine-specific restriction protein A
MRDKQYIDSYISKEWKITTNIIKSKYNGLYLIRLLHDDKLKSYVVIHYILEIKTNEGLEA